MTPNPNIWGQLVASHRRRGRDAKSLASGDTIGEWTLMEYRPGGQQIVGGRVVRKLAEWRCECSCGAQRWVAAQNLLRQGTTSCGHAERRGRPPAPEKIICLSS